MMYTFLCSGQKILRGANMASDNGGTSKKSSLNISDHLANERTFLAWIRTCLGIMAFGFVVEKFSIFLRNIAAVLLSASSAPKILGFSTNQASISSILGVALVILGGFLCIMAFIQYTRTRGEIDNKNYSPSLMLNVMLTLIVVLVCLFLAIYLFHTLI
jgi:putative membrane protein